MNCPRCNTPLPDNAKFCAKCGTPVAPPQEMTVSAEYSAPAGNRAPSPVPVKQKSNKKLIAALVVMICVLLILGIAIAIIALSKSKPISDEEIAQAKEDFVPPAQLYDIDSAALDPSDDEVSFTFDDRDRIDTCVYTANDREYKQKYAYNDQDQNVEIVTTYKDVEVARNTIAYDDLTYFNKTEVVDGYYVRLDEKSSDKLLRAKTGFDFGSALVDYNGMVYYTDKHGLWKNDGSDSKLLYEGSANHLATDGSVVYFGVYNQKADAYSTQSGTTLEWSQYDLYCYDLTTDDCSKVMSFVENGFPLCRIDDKIYYTDFEDDFDGFVVERSQTLCSYDINTGEKEYLAEGAHTLAMYQHKIFMCCAVGGIMPGIRQLMCYDIDAGKSEQISDDFVLSFKVIGDDLYYKEYVFEEGVGEPRSVIRRRCLKDDSKDTLYQQEGTAAGIDYYDEDYGFFSNGNGLSRYDFETDESEAITSSSGSVQPSDICKDEKDNYYFNDRENSSLLILPEGETEITKEVSGPNGTLLGVYYANAYFNIPASDYSSYEIEVVPIDPEKAEAPTEKETEEETKPEETEPETEEETEPETEEETEEPDYSDYVGVWTAEDSLDVLVISEIDGDHVKFFINCDSPDASHLTDTGYIEADINEDHTIDFDYIDSFRTYGHGTITLADGYVHMVVVRDGCEGGAVIWGIAETDNDFSLTSQPLFEPRN